VAERVDQAGAAFAGSQLQVQLWVNERPDTLRAAVGDQFDDLDAAAIRWVSPLRAERFSEYQDREFLQAVGLGHLGQQLSAFWPAGGPVWDGLGIVEDGDMPGVVLLEGKSYPDELYGRGCQAGPRSRAKIVNALAATQAWLGVDRSPEAWCGPLYQTANRLAHLYWLSQVVGVPAWFVHLLFTADPRSPTTHETSRAAIHAAERELGLPRSVPHAGHVFVEAGRRDELIGSG
jgi:hypothetical protein